MSSSSSSSRTDKNDTLEAAFTHIQRGNDREAQHSYWRAALEFDAAQSILSQLANAAASLDESDGFSNLPDDEQKKIGQLYRQKTVEYLQRARLALIAALKAESETDETATNLHENNTAYSVSTALSQEAAKERLDLFGRLFAPNHYADLLKQSASTTVQPPPPQQSNEALQKSLAERLFSLNESLPPSVKTSEERVRDINRGLGRLGYSLYSTAETTTTTTTTTQRPMKIVPSKNEDEQINDIIAQARDEVAMSINSNKSGVQDDQTLALQSAYLGLAASAAVRGGDAHADHGILLNDNDDDILVEESSQASDTGDEPELDTSQILSIRDKVIEAQVQLAQLSTLLEVDEGGDAEIEFCPSTGQHFLVQARKLLAAAANEWGKGKGQGGKNNKLEKKKD